MCRCPHQQAWDGSNNNNTQMGISGMKVTCGAVVGVGPKTKTNYPKSLFPGGGLCMLAVYSLEQSSPVTGRVPSTNHHCLF